MDIKCPICQGSGTTSVVTCLLCCGRGSLAVEKDSCCGYCGQRFRNTRIWPRKCEACLNLTYRNPPPVIVTMIQVDHGLLTVRRGIQPGYGKLALPGGFINFLDRPESWQEAGARELKEETNVDVDSSELRIVGVTSTTHGPILLFALSDRVRKSEDLPAFVENEEVLERTVINSPVELAFPSHTEMANKYFELEFETQI